mmetsp:Transcript_723/g.1321  ORF Transcript_723/g.1321 Transcript_723/m.1321 type:complete len:199 (+) Transcript_723:175-771(+)
MKTTDILNMPTDPSSVTTLLRLVAKMNATQSTVTAAGGLGGKTHGLEPLVRFYFFFPSVGGCSGSGSGSGSGPNGSVSCHVCSGPEGTNVGEIFTCSALSFHLSLVSDTLLLATRTRALASATGPSFDSSSTALSAPASMRASASAASASACAKRARVAASVWAALCVALSAHQSTPADKGLSTITSYLVVVPEAPSP